MAIEIFSDSPIHAPQHPTAVSPQTAAPEDRSGFSPGSASGPAPTPTPMPSSAATAPPPTTTIPAHIPAPQPGARPFLPEPTASASFAWGRLPGPPPTTASLPATSTSHASVAPPPGARVRPRVASGATAPATTPTSMPPQMAIPPPTLSSLPTSSTLPAPFPSALNPAHPPGYVQDDAGAAEFSGSQPAAHEAVTAAGSYGGGRTGILGEGLGLGRSGVGDDGDGYGVWDAAQRLVRTAGNSLATAENEVWKRIRAGKE